ncbi:MAG TPA: sn-glycerol-1-phosphate dehydrogenase [Thermohalobaculum sp.]|nr:sn-glycerol-1-phosphate dehydrogenase [Thermohalobaculum sp.]
MTDDAIARLLAGTLPDPDGGPPLSVPVRSVVIEPSLAGHEADLVRALDLGATLAVVSDPRTHAVLGERVVRALGSIASVIHVALPDAPHPDAPTAARIRQATASADALVAVGSGTINDLCKYAAARDFKPCAVFATAPSMNGYTSVNVAITVEGHKKSLPAVAPAGVFMDLEVLAAAPRRMIRSGLGDSICRCTAQADWLLAHLLLGTPYRSAPFVLLAADEDALIAESGALVAGDIAAVARLARTLILSGFGMTICGGSQPASQGEHLISHYIEMMHPPAWPGALHGEQIGVSTLTMARLQARILEGARPRPRPTRIDRAGVLGHFGARIGAACWAEFAAKALDGEAAERLDQRLAAAWDRVRDAVAAVTRPVAQLEAALTRAGAPTTPADLGLAPAFYADAVRHAREIRNRYTFLDLAGDAGRLDPASLV